MTDPCLAPDPAVRSPAFAMPAGATDAHFHLFGERSDALLVAERDYTPPPASASAARALFDAHGVSRLVLIQPSVHGRDNSDQLEEAARIGLPFRAIVVVPPDAPDAEMARLHERGARGVRYTLAHPGGLDPVGLERAADRARDHGWHLQFLVKSAQLEDLAPRLARLRCPVVVDHFGFVDPQAGLDQPAFRALLDLVRGGNAYAKVSGAYRISKRGPAYDDLAPFARALVEAGPDRVLWGSDWPHVGLKAGMPNTTDLVDALGRWLPDAAERERVLVDNPAILFDW